MNVLILTEGGGQFGYGHLARCAALSHAIGERNPKSKIQFILHGDPKGAKFVKLHDVPAWRINWCRDLDRIKSYVEQSDLVIVDSYVASRRVYEMLRRMNPFCLTAAIDDNGLSDGYETDFIINPDIYGDELAYGGIKNVTRLAGKRYAILRKPFWDVARPTLQKEVKRIFITLGGIDQRSLIKRIVSAIRRANSNVHLDIVSSHPSAIKNLRSISFYRQVNGGKFRQLMQRADICISGCGQTLHELARCGVPTIGIAVANNQKRNSDAWQQNGFLTHRIWCNDREFDSKLEASLNALWSFASRAKASAIGQSLIDGKGAKRVAVALLKETVSLCFKDAEKKDVGLVYRLRNHPTVRKHSFDTKFIKYVDHKNWFLRCLKDRKVRIYIVYLEGKVTRIGVLRFDNSPHGNHVSVFLDRNFRGRGLGSKLIYVGTRWFLSHSKTRKPIIAEVKKENVISQKAFRRAGYCCGPSPKTCNFFTFKFQPSTSRQHG